TRESCGQGLLSTSRTRPFFSSAVSGTGPLVSLGCCPTRQDVTNSTGDTYLPSWHPRVGYQAQTPVSHRLATPPRGCQKSEKRAFWQVRPLTNVRFGVGRLLVCAALTMVHGLDAYRRAAWIGLISYENTVDKKKTDAILRPPRIP